MSFAGNLNLSFNENKVVEGHLTYAVATNIPEGGYFRREGGFEYMAHNNGQKVYHPTYEGLIKSSQNHFLLNGGCTITYTFNEPNSTHVANYIEYLYSEGVSNVNFEFIENKLVVRYLAEYNNKEWDVFPVSYSPDAYQAEIEFDEGSDLLCVFRLTDSNEWTLRYKDCKAGEITSIDKAGDICYIFFGGNATKNGSTLTKYKFYKITSDSFDITANEDMRILRLHRD